MKKLISALVLLLFFSPVLGQVISEMEMVSPFHEGMASIKKDGQWAFIDTNGKVLIDFRNDLVPTETFSAPQEAQVYYPVFKDDRCQIFKTEDGIRHFGFIDKNGKEVIPAKYVNATNFRNGHAIVSEFTKEVVGRNKLLGKDVVEYQLEEFVIDKNGKVITSLMNARHYLPEKMKKSPPPLQSVFLGENLVGVLHENGQWSVYKF